MWTIGQNVLSMSNITEEVFENNTTLWDVLNAQGVPELAEQNRRLQDQLDSLGRTVQNYQQDTNASLITINTNIINIQDDIVVLNNNLTDTTARVTNLSAEVSVIDTSVTAIANQVAINTASIALQSSTNTNVNNRLNNLETNYNSLFNRIVALENEQSDIWLRFDQMYVVTAWRNFENPFTTHTMKIKAGTGPFGSRVPMNRAFDVEVDGVIRLMYFNIPVQRISPNNSGNPAQPLLIGLVQGRYFNENENILFYFRKQ